MNIRSKRVYDPWDGSDGYRILVDRLWPRGLKKEDLSLDLWAKFLAPSAEARRTFDHKPERFQDFSGRYRQELDSNADADAFAVRLLDEKTETVTLLYAARDRTCNHAMVLGEWLARKTGGTFIAG